MDFSAAMHVLSDHSGVHAYLIHAVRFMALVGALSVALAAVDAPASAPDVSVIEVGSKNMRATLLARKDRTLTPLSISGRDQAVIIPLCGQLYPGTPHRDGNGPRYRGPLSVLQIDGDTSCEPLYVSHTSSVEGPGVSHVVITLRDRVLPVTVQLHLRTYANYDIIEQWQVVMNGQSRPMQVPHLDSLYFQAKSDAGVFLEWYDSREFQEGSAPIRERLAHGERVLTSRDGNRHKAGPMPQFILGFGRQPQEDVGACMLCALAWSGNIRLGFSIDDKNLLEASVGMDDPIAPLLAPGTSRTSPACISAFSADGIGQASRNLHRWMRRYGMRDGNRTRLVDNNSWEGCGMDVSEPAVIEMMRHSAELGIELYVVDDGWFGNGVNARTSDRAGLGDWQFNLQRFPHGLAPVVEAGKDMGIAVGLWFEPEMLNEASALAKTHPEWVMRMPGREPARQRNQLALDVANPDVQKFMFHTVDDMLKDNPGLRMVKWDCNSNINNPYSPFLGASGQGDMLSGYLNGYYRVMHQLVEAHPGIDFQACAAGGGRADLGAMRFSHTFWLSDNTNPGYRLGAQWNLSMHMPLFADTCHVTHSGGSEFSAKYRFDVSMMGQLGLEIDTRKASAEYLAACKVGIAAYKELRPVLQLGDLYRHRHPADSSTPSLNVVSVDMTTAVVLAYQTADIHDPITSIAPLSGLDPHMTYRIREVNLPDQDNRPRLAPDAPMAQRGSAWMEQGVPLVFVRRFDSAALVLERLP